MKVGVVLFVVPDGPLSIMVFGAAVSTVKLRNAGVGSTLPAESVARTSKVCEPSARAAVVSGAEQSPQGPPSKRHSNVVPSSLEEKPNVGVGSFVAPAGPESIVVSGGLLSTLKLRWAGEASLFPAGSMARAWKLCGPSAERRGRVG